MSAPGGDDSGSGRSVGALLEVAVALPVPGTFTYRDPRPGAAAVVGTQVVVPFGTRTVTGFVVGRGAAPGGVEAKEIEEVVGGEPAFDEAMIAFGRWTADYYQAPLGEVLRAALPQGEQATAMRAVRLTDLGRRALERQGTLIADAPRDPVLGALADAGGELPLPRLLKLVPRAKGALARLVDEGVVEMGDEVQRRRPAPTVALAFAVAGDRASALPKRAAARRALLDKLAAAADGLPHRRAHRRGADAAAGAVDGGAGARRAPAHPARAGAAAGRGVAGHAQRRAGGGGRGAGGRAGQGGFASFLLHGVTGSGKTEVYLRVIAAARAAGRGALVLVPEIALTPQLAARFRARFGEDVAVLHSALPPRERLRPGGACAPGEVGIALGARSAVFAPVRALAVVVVDEEHDPSFKQEEGVRYHGRDLAIVRAQQAGALVDPRLGDAVAGERLQRDARDGSRRLSLPERATPRPLPAVEIVDLRRHPPGPDGLLSAPLADALGAALSAGEQSILFLNRRGFSTVMLCRACGQVVRCENCVVSMTYHRGRSLLCCHYCARTTPVPARCPSCQAARLERLGTGTERVEALVRERFPDARVARLDRDTAGSGSVRDLDAILRRMQAGEIDLLVGTQMVTKGHDFPGVTLVGVLQPDQGMHLPDFRAAERTFQLLEQVAGRAGRGDRPGRVIVQTYAPDHPAIAAVAQPRLRRLRARGARRAARRRLPAVHADDRAAPRRARGGRRAGRRQGGGRGRARGRRAPR